MSQNALLAIAFAVFAACDLALLHVMRDKFSGAVKALVLVAALLMLLAAWLLWTGRWSLA